MLHQLACFQKSRHVGKQIGLFSLRVNKSLAVALTMAGLFIVVTHLLFILNR